MFDWEALRAIPLDELLAENGLAPSTIARGRKFSCPLHPEHRHASYDAKRNRIRCWVDRKDLSAIDYWMAVTGQDLETAAAELSRRYGIEITEDDRPQEPPRPLLEHQQLYQRLRDTHGLSKDGLAYLVDRGFPEHFVRNLAARGLLTTNPKRVFLDEVADRRVYLETVTFPFWRVDVSLDAEGTEIDWARDASDVARPAALWHRFLEPPLDRDGKPDKHRNQGETRGAFFSTRSLRQLAGAKYLYITEGILKGLALDVAMLGEDLVAKMPAEGRADKEAVEKREVLQQRLKRIRGQSGRGDTGECNWSRSAWIALAGVGGTDAVLDVVTHIEAMRRRGRPSIRIALDRDPPGRRAAETLFRELTRRGFETLIVQPPKGFKDWDELLAKADGDSVREALLKEVEDPILRPGGRLIGVYQHRRGWELWFLEVSKKDGEESSEWRMVADFAVRSVSQIIPYDFAGRQPGKPVYQVRACTRASSNGVYGLETTYLSTRQFNQPDAWQEALGAVYAPGPFKRYLSNCKDMVMEKEPIVPVIGLVRVPGERDRYTLVGGEVRRWLNSTYRKSVECPYDNCDFKDQEWGGAADIQTARRDARRAHTMLAKMFGRPVGPMALYWIAGTMMKVVLRQYPHLTGFGQRGCGKSTFANVLQQVFGLQGKSVQTWHTPFRTMAALSNHTFPILADEISRITPKWLPGFLEQANSTFDVGRNTTHYGPDQVPMVLAGSLLMIGQDVISDSALQSKELSFELTTADRDAGEEPDAALLPRWPWRAWGEWLCGEITAASVAADLERFTKTVNRATPAGLGSRARFVNCWARLFLAREYVWRFLGRDVGELDELPASDPNQPVPGRPMGLELKGLYELMQAHASRLEASGMEALEMLHDYASIVASDPRRYPILVDLPEELDGAVTNRETAGVWFVPNSMLQTLRKEGRHYAVTTGHAFMATLKADGLLGSPFDSQRQTLAEWEGGAWLEDGTPRRRKIAFPGIGALNAYLIPLTVCERYGIEFPIRGKEADQVAEE